MRKPPHERVLARVVKQPNGCWDFIGASNGSGYGIVQLGAPHGTDRTHRVVYRHFVGEIPAGMTLDHLCTNAACCNPAHLEPVTRSENTKRQWADGRGHSGIHNSMKTHCAKGHPYDEENTYWRTGSRPGRGCRACARELARKKRQKITDP